MWNITVSEGKRVKLTFHLFNVSKKPVFVIQILDPDLLILVTG